MTDIADKKFYSGDDISLKLDISQSTLRKYCQILEQSNWTFTKNERKARIFTDDDIDLFKTFFELKKNLSMSLEKSSDMAVGYHQKNVSVIQGVSANANNALSEVKQNNVIQELRYISEKYNNKLDNVYQGQQKMLERMDQILDDNDELKKQNVQLERELKELKQEQSKSFFKKIFGG